MFQRSLSLLVLLFTVSFVAAIGPSWYSCDPATCIPANNCKCPSNQSPIATQDTPQFMLITHDDATNALTTNIMRGVVDGLKNPNGCNVPVTFFTTQQGSDCAKVREMFEMNHEIAAHTVNHLELRPDLPDMEKQILGVRDWLAAECGIPKDKIRGQRNPYLTHNPKTREIIAKSGFLYDSTINEYVGYGSTTTPNIENRLFPYTFDNGVVQDCAWNGIYSECNEKERYPGMWEIPMWDLFKDPSKKYEAKGNAITMDPPDPFNFLKAQLDITYNNNRAPLPIFLHSTWGNFSINVPDMVAETRKFVEYAIQQEGVWAVTMSQLIDWLKNPVPWSEYNYECKTVELSGPPQAEKCRTWTVQPNDTLIDIAAKTATTDMNEIIALNNMSTALAIQLGQKLKIPPYDDSCPTDATSVNQGGSGVPVTTPPVPGDNDDLVVESEKPIVPPPTVQTTCRKHVVKIGEILLALADTYGITAQEIVDANKPVLTSMNTGLQLGMQLNIPPFPECCNTDSCPKPVTGDRVEVMMKVAGLDPKDLKPEVMDRLNAMITKELSVEDAAKVKFVSLSNPAGEFTAATVAGRRLLAEQTTAVVVVAVLTDEPVEAAQKATAIVESEAFKMSLAQMGYTLTETPTIYAYVDNKIVAVPEAKGSSKDDNEATGSDDDDDSSSFPMWALAPIIIGGLAVVAAVVAGVVMMKKRKQQQQGGGGQAMYAGVTATLTTPVSKV